MISFPKSRISVVLLEGIHQSAADVFRADGYPDVRRYDHALDGPALTTAIRQAHLVGIRSRTRLDRAVLAEAGRLIAVGCFCIGTNQVDLDEAEARGIPVFNAPYSNTRSVAEFVIAEAVLLVRGVARQNAQAHRGVWQKSSAGSHEVRGKVIGVVGYGHIGTQVGLLAEALGMQVLFVDIVPKLALGNARPTRTLDDLLRQADVVTLHVPDTDVTRGMIGPRELGLMRPGASLINASRGSVVDLDALAAALDRGDLGGAALDVFPAEPASEREEFQTPLRRFDNVILTPHIAGSTEEAQEGIGREVAEKLIRFSNLGSTLTSVNFPEVSLHEHPGKHRFLHIHRNTAGMLSRINEVFSRHGVNIAAQTLETTARTGFVVIDVDAETSADPREIRKELDRIDGTIRTRLLY
jgi:D-3-phosphoglycerate dehydrogenase